MSREQIEEMTVDIGEIQEAGWRFVDNSEYTTDVFNFELATHLISKGYRKKILDVTGIKPDLKRTSVPRKPKTN